VWSSGLFPLEYACFGVILATHRHAAPADVGNISEIPDLHA
jgi:hypothetical protein